MEKRWPFLHILGLTLGLLVLIMGVIGVLVAFWGGTDRLAKTELKREAPPVRQCDRSSLRHEGRCDTETGGVLMERGPAANLEATRCRKK
ncbi:MAG: hypothetical protein FWD79_08670 [Desulfobulbus sp.]|nr:hypothetical protein [Desulfobulbus sp.]